MPKGIPMVVLAIKMVYWIVHMNFVGYSRWAPSPAGTIYRKGTSLRRVLEWFVIVSNSTFAEETILPSRSGLLEVARDANGLAVQMRPVRMMTYTLE